MLCLILINYSMGLFIDRYESRKKLFLVLAVLLDIGVLGYFKYFNFLIVFINRCTGKMIEHQEIVLPIGISYYCKYYRPLRRCYFWLRLRGFNGAGGMVRRNFLHPVNLL